MNEALSKTPPHGWEGFERFSFGDSPALADELLALVLAGKKTGTCWSVTEGQQTVPGQRSVVCTGAQVPACITETVQLQRISFNEVSPTFAASKGEGDGSLAYWRREHERYFRRLGVFSETMELWCETFKLVYIFPRC